MSIANRLSRNESSRSSLSEFAFEMEMEEGGWLPSNTELEVFASDLKQQAKRLSARDSPESTDALIFNWMRGCDYMRVDRGSFQAGSSEESENFQAGCTPAY
mmetsp:Transcript_49390/g.154891  ORF Transcript_49390/g.154891 Transcript_49390/m.154891 type:complete len:102 (+) Transcript_49390:310-615(+)